MAPATPTLRPALDPRLHAFRDDLADAALKGQIDAPAFAEGRRATVSAPVAALRRYPAPDAPRDTELLRGEAVLVFDAKDGFSWIQAESDGYVGYVATADLSSGDVPAPTHRVTALRSFLYRDADLKSPVTGWLSMNSPLSISHTVDRFSALADGNHVFTAHIDDLSATTDDYVAVAEQFLETPYLWGGRSSLGLDCSGLVQCALQAAGIDCPRDTDMQEATLGEALRDDAALERGDIVFWKGHVGIMADAVTLLHANATYMKTVLEPVEPAIARIATTDGPVTSIKRLR